MASRHLVFTLFVLCSGRILLPSQARSGKIGDHDYIDGLSMSVFEGVIGLMIGGERLGFLNQQVEDNFSTLVVSDSGGLNGEDKVSVGNGEQAQINSHLKGASNGRVCQEHGSE